MRGRRREGGGGGGGEGERREGERGEGERGEGEGGEIIKSTSESCTFALASLEVSIKPVLVEDSSGKKIKRDESDRFSHAS